jgi:multidrug efflux system membrane fusion protein
LTTESEGLFHPSRRNALIAVAVLLLIGLAAWYFTHGASRSGKSGKRPATTVGTAQAVGADMPVNLTAIGTVQPVVTATVRTQLAGTLFSIHFTEGQIVRKGQLLAQIDPRPYRLALAQAQANELRDQAQLNLAKVDLNRYRTLLSQDSIARQQVDTQAATAKQLEGTIAADKAAVGSAKLNLTYTAITAPVSGRVGLRQADIGNYLTPGDANGVVVITETDPIDVSFSLPQNQLPSVQQKLAGGGSMPVVARDQNGTAILAQGRFLTFDNQIDAASGTVKAKARFGNAAGTLFPNQFVNVSLLVDTVRKAVTVPVGAVRHGAQGDFVFLLQPDKTVKLQLVKTGPGDTARIAILSGVAVGQTVITEGADSLDDGSSVTLAGDKRGGGGADGMAGDKRGGGGADGKGGHKGGRRHKSGGGDGGGQ